MQFSPKEVSGQFFLHCLGKIKPGRRNDVGGSLTFISPKVAGLFIILRLPNYALLSGFFLCEGGAGKDSSSNKF